MTLTFEERARERGLVLPDEEPQPIPGKKKVIWNGRAMELVDDGAKAAASQFTFHSGESAVGYTETPTADSTKLLSGDYRVINTPATTKQGYEWKPGNRYTNRNFKLDPNTEGEPVLTNGKFTAFLTDDDNVHFKSGKVIWSEGRFRNCPGRTGHQEYESMCNRLRETSQWSRSRPPSKFEPGFAAYTHSFPDTSHAAEIAQAPLPEAPPGTRNIKAADGTITTIPETAALAKQFSATRLVPAKMGEIPNGPASFTVHHTETDDLRWLTRVVAQRGSRNEAVRGPGSIEFFESRGMRGRTMKLKPATAH